MTSQPIDTPVQPMRDSDLTAVLDNYLTALRRGEHPSKETLLRDHPHLAAELSGCLQTLDMLQACANFDVDVSDGDRDSVTQRSLGDYHLLREVGRGGMGVVYEAEQISLSRRVALKILPFAAVLDPRHLQRFKNEAMAAAHLDHPNIVEVYGIGCERSIHFYAMRFIEGVTLADVVEAKRRSLAGNVEERNPQVTSNSNDEAQTEVFSNSSDASLSTPHAALAAETSPVLQAALSTVNSITPKERFRRIAEIGIQAA
ncbi:MAG: protein kinase, partial [Planctomycetia bacterium]|nr:protein kinase [Planctomycetia bacterium]